MNIMQSDKTFKIPIEHGNSLILKPSFRFDPNYTVEVLDLLSLVNRAHSFSKGKVVTTEPGHKFGPHKNGLHQGIHMPRVAVLDSIFNTYQVSIAEGHHLIAYLLRNGITHCPVEMRRCEQKIILDKCGKYVRSELSLFKKTLNWYTDWYTLKQINVSNSRNH